MSSAVEHVPVVGSVQAVDRANAVDWQRLGRRAFLSGAFVVAAIEVYIQARGSEYGLDFRGGPWHAGWAVLHGLSPYPPPLVGERLLHASSGFMTPPPLALLGTPFSLPFWAAISLFNLLCAVAAIAALRVLSQPRS